MSDKTWKAAERRVAKLFGTQRNPLSGRNSKHTASDSLHPRLFIETKYSKRFALVNVYKKAKELARKEGKLPVLILVPKGSTEMYCMLPIEENVIEEFLAWLKKANGSPKGGSTDEVPNLG